MRRVLVFAVAASLILPQMASAVITFTQVDDDVFVVSHRIKVIGSRAKAMRMAYEKTASLCVAAGFSHYRLLEQESQAAQQYETSNATVQVQFYFEDGDGRVECERAANPEYIQQAHEKLAKFGYVKPAPPEPGEPAEASGSDPGSCTIEQITAMVRAGLSDAQVKAACPPGD